MNSKNIKVIDEHSIDRNANIMFAFELEGSEYVTYWIERDEDNSNIFVSRVIKNIDNTYSMLDVDDTNEKNKLNEIIKALITNSVESQADKLAGNSVTLGDGKVIKFIAVSFNKEQRLNIPKTYITTVKKEVIRVAEKYYYVEVVVEQPKVVENIFPTVNESSNDIFPEIPVQPTPVVVEQPQVVEPVLEMPVITETPVVTPTVSVEPPVQVLPTEVPVVEAMPASVVVEPITVTQPTPVVAETPVIEPVVVQPMPEPAAVVMPQEEQQPLVFNASKETNLNAALGEVASTATIPVENIQSVREFGIDAPVSQTTVVTPEPQPVAVNDGTSNVGVPASKNGGFANSKFFMFVAIAFFLASCVFLGYEVFSYFQITK